MADPRRICLLAAILVAVLTVPAAFGSHDRKHQVDHRIASLQAEIAQAKDREGVLTSEIESASSSIESLEGRIAVLNDRLAALESELAARRERLEQLEELFRDQTLQLQRLREQLVVAQSRLEERLVELYQTAETDELGILLGVQSLSELIDQIDYINEIGRQDRVIVDEVTRLKIETRITRKKTAATKAKVAKETAVLAQRTEEERAARQALVSEQASLTAMRAGKQGLLANVREDRQQTEAQLAALEAASAALTTQLQTVQSSAPAGGGAVSSSGLIWPVSGVLTSSFGPRWGRMHTGIDIAAPAGTAVQAAASGTVVYSGWLGGYGNLVVVDHGGGLATAYAHLSAIYAGGSVGQGQAIGAVGCTGSCTGNHLHFEVRVNGSPVDPMGYL